MNHYPASNTHPAGIVHAEMDVCRTSDGGRTELVAQPNTASLGQSEPRTTARRVLFVNRHAVTTNTQTWGSNSGDTGPGAGVVSGTVSGPCRIKSGSCKVIVEGFAAGRLGSLTAHNDAAKANMPAGCQIEAGQRKVVVAG